MMKIISFLLLFPFAAYSQEILTAEIFFTHAGTIDYNHSERSMPDFRAPWIDQYEFRTESEDFNFNKQEYLFRLSPSSPGIRKAQKRLYDHISSIPDFERMEYECQVWERLHEDWLDLFLIVEEQRILNEKELLLQDKQILFDRLARDLKFDPKDFLKFQSDKSAFNAKRKDLNTEKKLILEKNGFDPDEIQFDGFPATEEISSLLDLNPNPTNWPRNQEYLHENERIHRELDIENAEEDRLIDFVQMRYNGPHTDILSERLSLGLGIRLRNSGSRKLKIQELLLEIDRNQKDQWLYDKRKLEESRIALIELKSRLRLHSELSDQKLSELLELDKLRMLLFGHEENSPFLILDIEEKKIEKKLDILESKRDVYRSYLAFIKDSGQLCSSTSGRSFWQY